MDAQQSIASSIAFLQQQSVCNSSIRVKLELVEPSMEPIDQRFPTGQKEEAAATGGSGGPLILSFKGSDQDNFSNFKTAI